MKLRVTCLQLEARFSSPVFSTWLSELKHVQFEGLDCDIVQCYGASIPLHKALDPRVRYSHLLLLREERTGLISSGIAGGRDSRI